MQKRVLMVGAGPGGLASAMLLAKAGLDVKMIERMPRVGSRTSTLDATPDVARMEAAMAQLAFARSRTANVFFRPAYPAGVFVSI